MARCSCLVKLMCLCVLFQLSIERERDTVAVTQTDMSFLFYLTYSSRVPPDDNGGNMKHSISPSMTKESLSLNLLLMSPKHMSSYAFILKKKSTQT